MCGRPGPEAVAGSIGEHGKKVDFGFHASPGLLVLRSFSCHFPALCGGSADPGSLHLPGMFSATVYPLDLSSFDSGHISSVAPPASIRWTHCGWSFYQVTTASGFQQQHLLSSVPPAQCGSGSLLLLMSLALLSSFCLLSSSVTSVPSSLHYS